MTYVDSLISTGVDQLINLVHEKKRVRVEDAALQLGIAQKVVEEWARILEDEGVIKIDYQFTSAYLVWAGEVIAEPEKVKELREERDLLINEAESLSNKVKSLISESEKAGKTLGKTLSSLGSVSKGIKTSVDTLAEIKKESVKASAEATAMIEELESLVKEVSEKVKEYDAKLAEAEKISEKDSQMFTTLYSDYDRLVSDIKSAVQKLEKEKGELDKRFDEIKSKESTIEERLKLYSELKEQSFKDEVSSVRSDFNEIKRKYGDLNSALNKRLKEMRLALNTIKQFSKDVAELESKVNENVIARRYSEIRNIMDMLMGLENEEEALNKKLALLIKELRALKLAPRSEPSKETSEKISSAKKKIRSAKREYTLIEQKRKELLDLMKRIKKEYK